MINKLIKLADHLDVLGLTKEADYLDKIIKNSFDLSQSTSSNLIKSSHLRSHYNEPQPGQIIENINPGCKHFGSKGEVISLNGLDDDRGTTVVYLVSNTNGDTYKPGDTLEKTLDQLQIVG